MLHLYFNTNFDLNISIYRLAVSNTNLRSKPFSSILTRKRLSVGKLYIIIQEGYFLIDIADNDAIIMISLADGRDNRGTDTCT